MCLSRPCHIPLYGSFRNYVDNNLIFLIIYLLKYGSEEKGSSLCRCSILLGFIMSKNLRGLWFYLLIKVQNATSLVLLTWKNPGGWSIYRVKNPSPQIRILVNAWIVNNLSLVNIFGETGRLFYNINYMLNSKHLSLVNKIGDKTEFTITRVHCIRLS